MKLILICVALVVLLVGAVARAEVSEPGEPGFGLELIPARLTFPILADSIEIIVTAGCLCASDTRGNVHLSLPPGVSLISGDADRVIHPSQDWRGKRDSEYYIWLRVTDPGVYPIHAFLTVHSDDPRVWDEFEGVMSLTVTAQGISSANFGPSRWERVEGSQRFRYGGMHMVAIDRSAQMIPGRIDQPASVLKTVPLVCKHCGVATLPPEIHMAITVGANGRVRWIEPRREDNLQISDSLWNAAAATLKKWRFRPAKAGGVPVADWLEVKVPVRAASN